MRKRGQKQDYPFISNNTPEKPEFKGFRAYNVFAPSLAVYFLRKLYKPTNSHPYSM